MARRYFSAKQLPAVLVFSVSGRITLVVLGCALGLFAGQRLRRKRAAAASEQQGSGGSP